MASGLLGKARLPASTNTSIYTVPSGKTASVSINAVNSGQYQGTVTVFISTTGTPSAGDTYAMTYLSGAGTT